MKKGGGKTTAECGKSRGIGRNPADKNLDDEIVVPVCFGELSHRDAENIKELWEKTWSSDSRFVKKPKGEEK
jgi:hypothetical protein